MSKKYPKTERKLKRIVKDIQEMTDTLDTHSVITNVDHFGYELEKLAKALECYISEDQEYRRANPVGPALAYSKH